MEQTIQPEHVTIPDPNLQQAVNEPKGVIRKNLKVWIFLGACAVVVSAGLISNWTKKGSGHAATSQHVAPQPALQDNTDNNVQDLKNQIAVERQREAQAAAAQAAQAGNAPMVMNGIPVQPALNGLTPASQVGLCMPGQPCQQQQGVYAQPQVSPEEQQAQQLAARERELAYNARFASNLVYARSSAAQVAARQDPNPSLGNEAQTAVGSHSEQPVDSSLISPRSAAETKSTSQDSPAKRSSEVNIDSAAGQPYVIYEGLTMDTILMNRVDGDAPGPVKVMVSSPVYSHDHQHVLIPDGTVVLGEARKIGSNGFGQRRLSAG
jgi:type IV secretion system protein TrbI